MGTAHGVRGADLTDEQIAEVRRLRLEEGLSVKETSARTGVKPGTISQYAPSRPRTNPDRDWRILALARSGHTVSSITAELQLPYGIVADAVHWGRVQGYVTGGRYKPEAGPRELPNGSSPEPVRTAARAPIRSTLNELLPTGERSNGVMADLLEGRGETGIRPVRVRVERPVVVHLGSAPTPVDTETVVNVEPQPKASLRTRLLRAIAESDEPIEDTNALIRLVREPDDHIEGHEVQSILQSLNRQGLIKYRIHKTGAYKVVTRIEATQRGFGQAGLGTYHPEVGPGKPKGEPLRKGDRTDFRTHHGSAEAGPVIKEKYDDHRRNFPDHNHPPLEQATEADIIAVTKQVEPPAPKAEPTISELVVAVADRVSRFPLLAALRARAAARAENAARVAKYLEAAALLDDIDKAESERLLAMASALDGEGLSPLESEYLAFAQATDRTE